jgi:hypothetical protein
MPGPLVEANEGDTLICQSFSRFDYVFSSVRLFRVACIVNIVNDLSNVTASIVSAYIISVFTIPTGVHVHLLNYLLALARHVSER